MNTKKTEAGFTYVDVLIAMVILLIGCTALVGAIAGMVIRTKSQEKQLMAKQYATSTLESIISARDISVLGWDAVGNVGSNIVDGTPRGVFLVGEKPLRDGAGIDQIVGTSDDTSTVVTGFTRQITITDICDPTRPSANCSPAGPYPVMLRRVDVTIYYFSEKLKQQETVSTILSKY